MIRLLSGGLMLWVLISGGSPVVDEDTVGYTRYYGKTAVTDITVDTVPPVIGVCIIKRTQRTYFVAGV